MIYFLSFFLFFFFKQKTAYEMRISDWSSDVCSSDLLHSRHTARRIFDHRAALQLEGHYGEQRVRGAFRPEPDRQSLSYFRLCAGRLDRRAHPVPGCTPPDRSGAFGPILMPHRGTTPTPEDPTRRTQGANPVEHRG